MAIEPEFLECLNQKLPVAKPLALGPNGFSDLTHGAPVNLDARFEPQNRIIVNANGEEQVSNTLAIVDGAVTLEDHVWAPGTDSTDKSLGRPPKLVETAIDTDGSVHHHEVSL
jgi:hypothetical protein